MMRGTRIFACRLENRRYSTTDEGGGGEGRWGKGGGACYYCASVWIRDVYLSLSLSLLALITRASEYKSSDHKTPEFCCLLSVSQQIDVVKTYSRE